MGGAKKRAPATMIVLAPRASEVFAVGSSIDPDVFRTTLESAAVHARHAVWKAAKEKLGAGEEPKIPEWNDFMREMSALHALPRVLMQDARTSQILADDAPDLLVLHVAGTKDIEASHGIGSNIAKLASSVYMDVIGDLFSRLEEVHPGEVVHQSFVPHRSRDERSGTISAFPSIGRRLLAEAPGNGTSSGGGGTRQYTSAEISNYQIKAWTMVLLILISLATCWGFASMDTTLDPILRMKIKQGSKND